MVAIEFDKTGNRDVNDVSSGIETTADGQNVVGADR